ncbi:hypothetical protein BKA70DRAFT_1559499 [Coprinopsis sp. MPI-PUGE-AT-0042]|nr:hypothetical protein BKA70DRAFT_1559499 [Coprinopsis sp. MPI-PUGE-AT-0042]
MAHIQVRHIRDIVMLRTKDEVLLPHRMAVVTLPEELVAMIMMELDTKSLLRIRATCQTLNRISRGRHIWRNLFLTNLGTTIPRPFFLSKPLKDCSAGDIEADLRRWELGWRPRSRRPKIIERQVECVGDVERCRVNLPTLCMVPGGRWLIGGYEDGSIWQFDLSNHDPPSGSITRKLLIPSPFKDTPLDGSPIQLRLSIDFSSCEALGKSLETYHLEQFNIAVVACPKDYRAASTHVDVWRVHVPKKEDSESDLRLTDHLSSFTEIGVPALEDCSLLGPTLAYSLGTWPARCAVIVSWSEANGKPKDSIERRYLPDSGMHKILLLPGDRLLTVHQDSVVSVYDWAKTFPKSTLQPHEQQFTFVNSLWMDAAPMRNVLGISTPMTINGTIRVIVPSTRFLSGYTIPLEGDITKTFNTCLKRARFGYTLVHAYGYHRGLGFSDFSNLTSSEYRWPGETVLPETRPAAFLHHPIKAWENYKGGRMLLDQYSNVAVATDFYASRLFFISFTD